MAFFFGGITQNKGVQLFKDVNAANPDMKLFGPDGVADSPFYEKVGANIAKNAYITAPTLDPKEYPPAAQDFYKEFKAKYGKDPEPYAIYGYEAMAVTLDAIKRAGDKRQRPPGRGGRVLQDEGPGVRARHLRHRRERRHHAVRLRRKPDRERQARLRQGHQGPDVVN